MLGVTSFTLDPDQLAHLEASSWRAYYGRSWLHLLRLLVLLCRTEFSIPLPQYLLAAYYATRGAIAWAPVDHDLKKVHGYYARFYRLASHYSGLGFDPELAAALEVQWNDAHRRLVRQANKREFIETLTALHSLLFGITPDLARESAELRVLANSTVDLITGGLSQDVEGDWSRLEGYLRKCYRSINRAMAAPAPVRPGPIEHTGSVARPSAELGCGATH
jgi:hypothetical protein